MADQDLRCRKGRTGQFALRLDKAGNSAKGQLAAGFLSHGLV
jgi:hypothetical protein